MTLSENQIQYMIEGMTADLIRLVMERENLSMPDAFDKVYNSRTYKNLLNPLSQFIIKVLDMCMHKCVKKKVDL